MATASSAIWATAVLLTASSLLLAQEPPATRPADPLTLDPVIVTARKRAEAVQDVPQPITVITAEQIQDAGIRDTRQAAQAVPNLTMTQFTARKLTFPFIRGIGSGRNSPAVATYIDGVPQFSFTTTSTELVEVERVEFLRGPQGTLYGRNALGGVINIISRRPTSQWEFSGEASSGNFSLEDYRATVKGPVSDNLYFGLAGGWAARDGYSINEVTGNDVDSREAWFGRGQMLWKPTADTEVLFTMYAEQDRDGDYALFDLESIRQRPYRIQRDYQGSTQRDIYAPALIVTHRADNVEISSISAWQGWETDDKTDLDATAADLIRRFNNEEQSQVTQELRFSSPADRPVDVSRGVTMEWVAGVLLFASNYDQDATSSYSAAGAGLLGVPFAFAQTDKSSIDTYGGGAYGQVTFTFGKKLDVTLGARYDYEQQDATLRSFTDSPFLPSSSQDPDENFERWTGRIGLAWHWTEDLKTYGSIASGYKAGGFNTSAPAGNTSFGPEDSVTYELGLKSSHLNNRLIINPVLFYIDWDDMQLDVPNPAVPGQFYIDNVGQANSKGFEIEILGRPLEGLDVFGGFGYVSSEFDDYTLPGGGSTNGNDLPFAPNYTWNAGAQYTVKLTARARVFARGEVFAFDNYYYDATNAQQQNNYAIANFRLGFAGKHWRLEGWINNAFDVDHVPVALPFPLAPSGYLGESGAPQTYGVSFGITF